ncbi:protein FAR-RED ELONGATED HYPOCOTYL 3-like [Cucumis melo var. makuwa]|uniref:Protein FAR-RED ELONGATED HYPOCOTYL 3-like n=1 Tax=Cucumis melo var. makuwa TaxID=1194695 RepID=A0A5D3CUZ6_CUCMM|nr:protein FAR-RED ELONGATED HYPOCOTYL 3-like [Cucumis melo var. makuwa]
MALQRVKTVFDGRWIESCRYIDYRLLDVYVPVSSSFQEFANCIQRRLFPNSEVSVSRLTVYWKDCNNSNLIRIVDDKDVSWIMLVISKFPDNDLLVVVETVPATDIGNTPYLSSELPRTEDSHIENAPCRPSDVINYMKIHHGVNVSNKAWRGYEIALNSIRGTSEDSYAMLSTFLDALIRNNLGTYTAEETDDEVISVDGATMKNKYLGTLISACTIDGNSQIVTLAFVVVDSENDLSCIENGFNAVYGIAEHGLCAFHLLKNLKKNHKSLPMEDSFNKCVRAYTPLEFEYYMRQLEQLSPSMRHELEAVGRHRWARAFFRRKRYQIYPVDQHEFEVHHRKEQFFVNILNRTCSCRQWDLDLIPCSHACIALSTRNLNLHLYTDKFDYVSNLINMYKKGTRPIGSVNQIRNTHQGGNDGILPPQVKRPAGRPKKKRFASFLEKKAIVHCNRCGKKGHNCRSCKEPI